MYELYIRNMCLYKKDKQQAASLEEKNITYIFVA